MFGLSRADHPSIFTAGVMRPPIGMSSDLDCQFFRPRFSMENTPRLLHTSTTQKLARKEEYRYFSDISFTRCLFYFSAPFLSFFFSLLFFRAFLSFGSFFRKVMPGKVLFIFRFYWLATVTPLSKNTAKWEVNPFRERKKRMKIFVKLLNEPLKYPFLFGLVHLEYKLCALKRKRASVSLPAQTWTIFHMGTHSYRDK